MPVRVFITCVLSTLLVLTAHVALKANAADRAWQTSYRPPPLQHQQQYHSQQPSQQHRAWEQDRGAMRELARSGGYDVYYREDGEGCGSTARRAVPPEVEELHRFALGAEPVAPVAAVAAVARPHETREPSVQAQQPFTFDHSHVQGVDESFGLCFTGASIHPSF